MISLKYKNPSKCKICGRELIKIVFIDGKKEKRDNYCGLCKTTYAEIKGTEAVVEYITNDLN